MIAGLLAGAYCAAAWLRQTHLVLAFAGILIWLVPFDIRWWASSPAQARESRQTAGDLVVLGIAWSLGTWALWQHRPLPLAICTVAAVLVLADRAARRLAFARRAGIL